MTVDNMVAIRVWGSRAQFTCPHFRADPFTEPVMTPSAAYGILRAIYWKPEFEWEVSRIFVEAPIRYVSEQMSGTQKHRGSEGPPNLMTVTKLVDVQYVIEARFRLNRLRQHPGRSLHTYGEIIRDKMRSGNQWKQPFLGTSECVAHWLYLEDPADRHPIDVSMDLGSLLVNQLPLDPSKDTFEPHWAKFRLAHGVLTVPRQLHDVTEARRMEMRDAIHSHKREDDHDSL